MDCKEMNDERLPFMGLRVIEFCQVAAGPFCGMLLADMGADVIKVEHPSGGDSMRAWPPLTDGFSENFASLNRNKRSVALDLKDPRQRSAALELCLTADVVVENNRPGAMQRNGLGYQQIAARNPKIVYCSISGFGQSGPRGNEGGFDVTIQAIAGVMSVTGEPGAAPVKCGVPISDFATGLYAAYSIAAALRDVARTGKGANIDISLLGSTLAVAALQTSQYFGTGTSPLKTGSAHPRNAPYQAFKASDDYFVMAAGNNKLWEAVCEVVERHELLQDDRFKTTSDRAENQAELTSILEPIFLTKSARTWLEAFRNAGVPCAPINDYAAALDDPQVHAMGWVQELELPSGATTRTFGSPVRFDGRTMRIARRPPALGEHTEEVLASLRRPASAAS
jgi:crotonobetainyl-CoA:carnitine CoA-transferase CaiB-like acyl-CoA transferase